MTRALRRSRLRLAASVLALLGALQLTASPLLHASDVTVCDPLAVTHDGSAHRLGGGGSAPADLEHCLVCSCSRSVRAIQDKTPDVGRCVDSALVVRAGSARLGTAAATRTADRAPPSLT
jgi:hypothetical protein